MINIELTEQDAKDFLLFRKHQDLFYKLEPSLDIEFGKITLNFAFGELQNIVKEQMSWRNGK